MNFELYRPSNKGIKLLLKEVIKTIIIVIIMCHYNLVKKCRLHAHLYVEWAQNDDPQKWEFY